MSHGRLIKLKTTITPLTIKSICQTNLFQPQLFNFPKFLSQLLPHPPDPRNRILASTPDPRALGREVHRAVSKSPDRTGRSCVLRQWVVRLCLCERVCDSVRAFWCACENVCEILLFACFCAFVCIFMYVYMCMCASVCVRACARLCVLRVCVCGRESVSLYSFVYVFLRVRDRVRVCVRVRLCGMRVLWAYYCLCVCACECLCVSVCVFVWVCLCL